jgi:hypothetical protein
LKKPGLPKPGFFMPFSRLAKTSPFDFMEIAFPGPANQTIEQDYTKSIYITKRNTALFGLLEQDLEPPLKASHTHNPQQEA